MEIIALFHGSGGDEYSGWERAIYWFLIIGVAVGGVALLIFAVDRWKKLRRRKE